MNNTKTRTLSAIAVMLIAAALVVGGTLAATSSQSALAYIKKKGTRDNGNSKNGNTDTIQACKQRGSVSGFDNTAEQECQNVICTHPGNNATCVTESEAAVTPVTPVTPVIEECGPGFNSDVTLRVALGDLKAGTELCLPKKLGNQLATVVGDGTVRVVVDQPDKTGACDPVATSVKADVTSGPFQGFSTVCVKLSPAG
jgi:hypothetical protein